MHFACAFWWEMKKVSVFLFCAVAPLSFGQSVANLWNGSLNRYEQNFDSLPNTPPVSPAPNITVGAGSQILDLGSAIGSSLSGWHLVTSSTTGTTGRQLLVDNGGSSTGNFYSYGATGNSERALGTLSSGSAATSAKILRIRNNGAISAQSDPIEFRWLFEQWRGGAATTADVQSFDYSFQASTYALTATDGLAATASGIWTRDNLKIRVNGTTPVDWNETGSFIDDAGAFPATHNVRSQAGSATGALDGNTVRSVRVGQIVNTHWVAGTDLLLRWRDTDATGADHGFAIDDVKVVPEPATLAMFAVGLGGLVRKRRK